MMSNRKDVEFLAEFPKDFRSLDELATVKIPGAEKLNYKEFNKIIDETFLHWPCERCATADTDYLIQKRINEIYMERHAADKAEIRRLKKEKNYERKLKMQVIAHAKLLASYYLSEHQTALDKEMLYHQQEIRNMKLQDENDQIKKHLDKAIRHQSQTQFQLQIFNRNYQLTRNNLLESRSQNKSLTAQLGIKKISYKHEVAELKDKIRKLSQPQRESLMQGHTVLLQSRLVSIPRVEWGWLAMGLKEIRKS